MSVPSSDSLLERAQSALSRGQPREAAEPCREVLRRDPRHTRARYLLGLAHALDDDAESAIREWQRVLEIQPRDFATQVNLGVALARQERHLEALPLLRAALATGASHANVHYNLGTSLLAVGELESAAQSFRAALAHDPRLTLARINLGVAYRRLGRPAEAREEFAAAIAADPSLAVAHSNLGSALLAEGRLQEALGSFTRAWQLDGHSTEAALGIAQTFERLDRPREALACLEAAAIGQPKQAEIHHALGVARHRSGDVPGAIASYEHCLALRPHPEAWRGRGQALERLQRLTEALESYRKGLALAPDDPASLAGVVSCSVRICQWAESTACLERLTALPGGIEALHPFLALSVLEDPETQSRIAAAFCRRSLPPAAPTPFVPRKTRERIRIAYVSSDLREHAVGYLLAPLLEHHDRGRFEIHAVSLQAAVEHDEIGRRLQRAVEHYHDVSSSSDAEAARLLRDREVDIAVDLNGYTIGGRPAIFAHRAAPVQASYMGYAGTSGAPYTDYLVADATVIPPGAESHYSEHIVRLPFCYLSADLPPVGNRPARAQAGLPDTALVLCAFTHPYKIRPPVFDVWMSVLRQIPGAILWLREMGNEPEACLRSEALKRGVDPARLLFAPRLQSTAEHLSRQSLADLYLDTLPYNAHSTALDALGTGVPVLTCAGSSFASRVAGSALAAVGLPELITHNLKEYEDRALELGSNPQRLRELREHLSRHRKTSPLFDTARHCRYLEAAFSRMHERCAKGESPSGFSITP